MDLHHVEAAVRAPSAVPGADWQPGDAWLAGGTWLFSEPQPDVRRLVDLDALGWEPLVVSDAGLSIAATCTVAELFRFAPPDAWPAASLIGDCCRSFLASFKVWNMATVGGNICMSLPAGPMISLTVALDATYVVWPVAGGERAISAADFVTGVHQNVLGPGDLLRSIEITAAALERRCAFRRFSETQLGRSEVLVIGTRDPEGSHLTLTVTAGTIRPVRVRVERYPEGTALTDALDHAIPTELWFDDPNGTPEHRRHLTALFAEEIRRELS